MPNVHLEGWFLTAQATMVTQLRHFMSGTIVQALRHYRVIYIRDIKEEQHACSRASDEDR
jgi:hypothetical protein